jgi:hypothetical protein
MMMMMMMLLMRMMMMLMTFACEHCRVFLLLGS